MLVFAHELVFAYVLVFAPDLCLPLQLESAQQGQTQSLQLLQEEKAGLQAQVGARCRHRPAAGLRMPTYGAGAGGWRQGAGCRACGAGGTWQPRHRGQAVQGAGGAGGTPSLTGGLAHSFGKPCGLVD